MEITFSRQKRSQNRGLF